MFFVILVKSKKSQLGPLIVCDRTIEPEEKLPPPSLLLFLSLRKQKTNGPVSHFGKMLAPNLSTFSKKKKKKKHSGTLEKKCLFVS